MTASHVAMSCVHTKTQPSSCDTGNLAGSRTVARAACKGKAVGRVFRWWKNTADGPETVQASGAPLRPVEPLDVEELMR